MNVKKPKAPLFISRRLQEEAVRRIKAIDQWDK